MKRNQKGYLPIEMAIGLALIAMIAVGTAMTIKQMLDNYHSSMDRTTVIRQAQNVGYWVCQDAMMAQTIEIGDDSDTTDETEFITIHWKDWESGDTFEFRYLWVDSDGAQNVLMRNKVIRDKNGVITSTALTLVADYINSAVLSEQAGGWKLSVQACSGDVSADREYTIVRRLET